VLAAKSGARRFGFCELCQFALCQYAFDKCSGADCNCGFECWVRRCVVMTNQIRLSQIGICFALPTGKPNPVA
jgi:hypothetical protein